MNCPVCNGKGEIKGTVRGVQHRKCEECGHRFRTKKQVAVVQQGDEIKDLLSDYGLKVRPETLVRLTKESNGAEIQDYLQNQGWIIQCYEAQKNESVIDHTAFMMNAILTHQPIPPRQFNGNGHYQNGNGYHHEVLTVAPSVAPKSEAAELWAEILERLEQKMTKATFDNWLKSSKGVYKSETMLVVQVANRFAMEWLEERLAKKVFEESDGLEIRFIV